MYFRLPKLCSLGGFHVIRHKRIYKRYKLYQALIGVCLDIEHFLVSSLFRSNLSLEPPVKPHLSGHSLSTSHDAGVVNGPSEVFNGFFTKGGGSLVGRVSPTNWPYRCF